MKPPGLFGHPDFWRGLVITLVAALSVYLYSQNRDLINLRDDTLVNLCETKAILRESVRQLRLIDIDLGMDSNLAPSTRLDVKRRVRVYNVMLEELSRTEPCERVE